MSFLSAEWRKLILANYEIDPSILEPYVPAHTEIDFYEGRTYVSLVGFLFQNTKLKGITIPFHRTFEEVNLRFYVRYKENGVWKRGTVFISEIVPKAAITLVANSIYKEHYRTLPMKHSWINEDNNLVVNYEWKVKNEWQKIGVTAENQLTEIETGSFSEFITEHYWGYTKITGDQTSEYEVTHPKWRQYKVKDVEIQADFGELYGNEFAFLSSKIPHNVILAEGSAIRVEGKKLLKRKH